MAQAYLTGGNYAGAIEIFSAIALEDRGNPEALAGLNEALVAQAGATATAAAPPPTALPPTPAPVPAAGVADTFAARWRSFAATALALLLVVGLVYAVLRVVRWAVGQLREFWAMRIRPLLGRSPQRPGIIVGEFVDGTGLADYVVTDMVSQTIEEHLVRWNAAAPAALRTPVVAHRLDRAGLNWLGALWAQVSPPPRAYLASGLVLGQSSGPFQLSVQRTNLHTARVDAGHTFAATGMPSEIFRELAGIAAYWLRDPSGMEGTPDLLAVVPADGATQHPLRVADQILDLLIPVRQQVERGAVDYRAAPRALDEAQALVSTLPAGSSLRQDLQAIVDDLRTAVQPGRA